MKRTLLSAETRDARRKFTGWMFKLAYGTVVTPCVDDEAKEEATRLAREGFVTFGKYEPWQVISDPKYTLFFDGKKVADFPTVEGAVLFAARNMVIPEYEHGRPPKNGSLTVTGVAWAGGVAKGAGLSPQFYHIDKVMVCKRFPGNADAWDPVLTCTNLQQLLDALADVFDKQVGRSKETLEKPWFLFEEGMLASDVIDWFHAVRREQM